MAIMYTLCPFCGVKRVSYLAGGVDSRCNNCGIKDCCCDVYEHEPRVTSISLKK